MTHNENVGVLTNEQHNYIKLAMFAGHSIGQWIDPDPIVGNDYEIVGVWGKPADSEALIHYSKDKNTASEAEVFVSEIAWEFKDYRWDWNPLMIVISKIEERGFSVLISSDKTIIQDKRGKTRHNVVIKFTGKYSSLRETVYTTVLEFIKWYNEN